MSFSSPDNLSLASLGTQAGIPALNPGDVPANIRNGDKAARQAYSEGLAFEQVLVNQLTRQMASSMSGSSSPDGSALGGSSSSGLAGGSAFSSLIPQALTQSIMSGGGVGIAEEFAASVDPSLNLPKPAASASGSATGTNGSAQVKR